MRLACEVQVLCVAAAACVLGADSENGICRDYSISYSDVCSTTVCEDEDAKPPGADSILLSLHRVDSITRLSIWSVVAASSFEYFDYSDRVEKFAMDCTKYEQKPSGRVGVSY